MKENNESRKKMLGFTSSPRAIPVKVKWKRSSRYPMAGREDEVITLVKSSTEEKKSPQAVRVSEVAGCCCCCCCQGHPM